MALDYRAILLGQASPADLVARLYPDDVQRPGFDVQDGIWAADDRALHGYTLYVDSRPDGYLNVSRGDDGEWIAKELPAHVEVEFVLDKRRLDIVDAAVLEMLARLLDTGDEDIAVLQNGDVMLLSRYDGELKRYRAGFWDALEPDEIPELFRIPEAAPSE